MPWQRIISHDTHAWHGAFTALRDATFNGRDLVHDEAANTFTLTVTRPESQDHSGSLFFRRKPSCVRTSVTVRHITGYRQYLAGETDDVFIIDRVEVGRGGQELAFCFRPGDRAVMDVGQITGTVEDVGKATSAPRRTSTSRRIFSPRSQKRG